MHLSIWFDVDPDPYCPWHYAIDYLGQHSEGCASSLHDCWVAFDAIIINGTLEDRVITRDTLTQDNDPPNSTRH